MIVKAFLLAFIIVFLSQNSFAKNKDTSPKTKLKAVYVTIRSGPTEVPNREWKLETNVEAGYMITAKLSEAARETMYNLGKVIRTYYQNEQNITLIPRSCSLRRCKASAALFRKGFEKRNFDKKIEVSEEEMRRTFDEDFAYKRMKFDNDCPKMENETITLMPKVWTENRKKMFNNAVDLVRKNLRQEILTTQPFYFWVIWECINTASKERPEWMTDEVDKDFMKISALYFKTKFSSTMARKLSAGSLVNEILSDASNFNEDEVQIEVYAGQVAELEAVVATFSGPRGYHKIPKIDSKIRNLYFLPHGSAIMIEIHELLTGKRDGNNKYGLKILFKVGKSDTLVTVRIKGCDQDICPLETIQSLLGNYALEAEKIKELCFKED